MKTGGLQSRRRRGADVDGCVNRLSSQALGAALQRSAIEQFEGALKAQLTGPCFNAMTCAVLAAVIARDLEPCYEVCPDCYPGLFVLFFICVNLSHLWIQKSLPDYGPYN